MSNALKIGQFYGAVAERWQAGAMVFNRLVHNGRRRLPGHAHQAAYVSLMLRGEYREKAAQFELEHAPLTCVYHPPGIEHSDEVGERGVSFFTFEFDPCLFADLDAAPVDLRSIRNLSGSQEAFDLTSIATGLARGASDPLELETAATELAFSMLRSPSRQPALDRRLLRQAREFIHSEPSQNFTLTMVATAVHAHPVYLGHLFRRELGMTLGEYVNRLRVRAAAARLAQTTTSLADIAAESGFYDQSHFSRTFKRLAGCTPGQFRAQIAAS